MTGGLYSWEKRLVHALVGGGRFSWETVGLFLIWLSRALWSESSIDCSEAVSFPLSGCGVGVCGVGLSPSYVWSQGISSPRIGWSGRAILCQWSFQRQTRILPVLSRL